MSNTEYIIPGTGYIQNKDEDEEFVVPDYGYHNEETAEIGAGAPAFVPRVVIY